MTSDLNANLEDTEDIPQGESIADKLAAVGILDMGMHFLPRRKPWLQGRFTFIMRRDVQEVRSWVDYILIIYRRMFQDIHGLSDGGSGKVAYRLPT